MHSDKSASHEQQWAVLQMPQPGKGLYRVVKSQRDCVNASMVSCSWRQMQGMSAVHQRCRLESVVPRRKRVVHSALKDRQTDRQSETQTHTQKQCGYKMLDQQPSSCINIVPHSHSAGKEVAAAGGRAWPRRWSSPPGSYSVSIHRQSQTFIFHCDHGRCLQPGSR